MVNLLLYNHSFIAHFSTFFIAILPLVETKGAIPIGMGLGLSPIASFICSYLGSLVPVPFLLVLFAPLLEYLEQNKKFQKMAQKINSYLRDKIKKIRSQTTLKNSHKKENEVENSKENKPVKLFALFLFVFLPIPGTGVWSGSVVASALKLKKVPAFFTIAAANFLTSLLVFLATFGFFV